MPPTTTPERGTPLGTRRSILCTTPCGPAAVIGAEGQRPEPAALRRLIGSLELNAMTGWALDFFDDGSVKVRRTQATD